ncbi:MAG TPA: DUF2330 domain-containing protein [Candidatus Binataceae bacterium]|nr:DUF2330 domain-containing protein [Candidatus Binataceae bacterium]
MGKANGTLHNRTSKVVLVHHEDKTVISIMSDYQGDLAQFAMVVPVPVVLQRGQIHIGDAAVIRHLEDYSAPRLVEYDDPNPCQMYYPRAMTGPAAGALTAQNAAKATDSARALGVKIEAQYTVGEYDIVILSALQSDGLQTWLTENGYRIPPGAGAALAPYIRDGMKFFVARVNLKEQAKTGLDYLRPIQFAFESPKFMLPIRLGMVNAAGPQDLVIYLLTENGRVETTDYRTIEMPTGTDVPQFVRDDFAKTYQAIFDRQVKLNQMRGVFTEYVWNMNWCDPCAAPPLSHDELRELGVFWLDNRNSPISGGPQPMYRRQMFIAAPAGVILTRLHVRYSAATFPEDLSFQETGDSNNFQVRYVLHRPWEGSPQLCPAAASYFRELDGRRATEARNLADLTGWELADISRRMGISSVTPPSPWWQNLWH